MSSSSRFLVTFLLLTATACTQDRGDAINAIVGDASWIALHGAAPDADTPEDARIRAHLLWIEDELRAADVSRLDPAMRAERTAMLDVLHGYALAGVYPRLEQPRPRTPRFVDHLGTLCAVAHLVRATEGRDVAESIGRAHEHELVMEMDEPRLDAWAATHGFTRLELASIQPSYGFMDAPPHGVDPPPPTTPATREELERVLAQAQGAILACVPETRPGATTITVRAFLRPGARPTVHVVTDIAPRDPAIARCVEAAVRRNAMRFTRSRTVRRIIEATIRLRAARPAQPPLPGRGPGSGAGAGAE